MTTEQIKNQIKETKEELKAAKKKLERLNIQVSIMEDLIEAQETELKELNWLINKRKQDGTDTSPR